MANNNETEIVREDEYIYETEIVRAKECDCEPDGPEVNCGSDFPSMGEIYDLIRSFCCNNMSDILELKAKVEQMKASNEECKTWVAKGYYARLANDATGTLMSGQWVSSRKALSAWQDWIDALSSLCGDVAYMSRRVEDIIEDLRDQEEYYASCCEEEKVDDESGTTNLGKYGGTYIVDNFGATYYPASEEDKKIFVAVNEEDSNE